MNLRAKRSRSEWTFRYGKVRKVLKIAQQPITLETPIGEEEDSHLGDFIEDRGVVSSADAVINMNLKELTEQVLNRLTPREERIIKMRFGLEDGTGHTLEEVGHNFGVTVERIRQIEAKDLRKHSSSQPQPPPARILQRNGPRLIRLRSSKTNSRSSRPICGRVLQFRP